MDDTYVNLSWLDKQGQAGFCVQSVKTTDEIPMIILQYKWDKSQNQY